MCSSDLFPSHDICRYLVASKYTPSFPVTINHLFVQLAADYLYISLGGNRKGKFRQYLNLIITMFLGGLWHGASWNFVLWGTFHGVALALHKMWMTITGRKKGEQSHGWRRVFGVIITFHFVCFCWIFFRNADFQNSMDMLGQIFTTFRPQLFPQLLEGYWKVFALMLLGFLLHFAPDSWENAVCRGVIRLS